jgi:hypothetical protein
MVLSNTLHRDVRGVDVTIRAATFAGFLLFTKHRGRDAIRTHEVTEPKVQRLTA